MNILKILFGGSAMQDEVPKLLDLQVDLDAARNARKDEMFWIKKVVVITVAGRKWYVDICFRAADHPKEEK